MESARNNGSLRVLHWWPVRRPYFFKRYLLTSLQRYRKDSSLTLELSG